MFGTMAGGVNPGRGRPEKNWAQCLVNDIRVFEATEGSTDSSLLLFGVETVLWPSATKKSGNWHRGIVDAADRFMTRRHRGEAEKSWQRLTAEDVTSEAPLPALSHKSYQIKTAKGGLHGRNSTWCALVSQARLAMWIFWDALLALLRPLGALIGSGGGSGSITLQNGTRVRYNKTPVAEGGFSFVYRARKASTGEHYALKKILCQVDEQRELALAEMRSHREFSHPNLMPLLDWAFVGVPQGEAAFLLFPFMERSLRDVIDTRLLGGGPPLGEVEALVIFAGVCRGVVALHQHTPSWAHRDIKPENVMIDRDGTPVLMDFGSVAVAECLIEGRTDALAVQDEAARHSTLPFRAPELFDVASDAHLDQRTDVWSLGCLLYALRYGFSPFECEFVGAGAGTVGLGGGGVRVVECSFLRVIGQVTFPPGGRASEGLKELVMFALQQDPLKRPFVEEVLERAIALAGVEVREGFCVD
eukprot:jgi/Undpi1/13995/HiC_scaffold_9.g03646.m1